MKNEALYNNMTQGMFFMAISHLHVAIWLEVFPKHNQAVSDFLDGIAREQMERIGNNNTSGDGGGEGGEGEVEVEGSLVDEDEIEMMKKLGIPIGFDSTKGKPVPGADVSGVRVVTKRQPRQYMNRRGGFNRPLPPERNR
ncbi:hypothetical protein GH714_002603 [Hevea brasiliensis]|uniref:U4/U6.U5 small nuclear ribonucleoprotein 27kDa protein domain-containing protein n=1 Tax=Hevea brasiliensis TaxID=3981 RepID=A0A6A6MB52_HEVBR|nr:hypothetical protein GH714_002603 [Hevea brasiliensis]